MFPCIIPEASIVLCIREPAPSQLPDCCYSLIALTDLRVSRIASQIREKLLCLFTIKAATPQYLGRMAESVEQVLALINNCNHTIQTLML